MSDLEHEDPVIERAAAELRRPVGLDPEGRTRVMAAVRAATPIGGKRGAVLAWLTRPRAIMVSPLAGLALAAALAFVMVAAEREGVQPAVTGTGAAGDGEGSRVVRPAAGHTASEVQFVLLAPEASRVALVGSFNDWDDAATPLRRTATGGVWSVTVPLVRGRHVYAFVIDGSEWMADPAAPRAPDDDFGSPNSVILIGESST